MAFKDKFDKLISYFDTDEVSDVEETVEEEAQRHMFNSKQKQYHNKPKDVLNQFKMLELSKFKVVEQLVNVHNSLNKDEQLKKINLFVQ